MHKQPSTSLVLPETWSGESASVLLSSVRAGASALVSLGVLGVLVVRAKCPSTCRRARVVLMIEQVPECPCIRAIFV
jgi:hypothetical protein